LPCTSQLPSACRLAISVTPTSFSLKISRRFEPHHPVFELEGFTANATDGDVGRAVDFLLDDERWAVRYLVVEPGTYAMMFAGLAAVGLMVRRRQA
jgi:hypothetical protein